jgi:hypothetical protein
MQIDLLFQMVKGEIYARDGGGPGPVDDFQASRFPRTATAEITGDQKADRQTRPLA